MEQLQHGRHKRPVRVVVVMALVVACLVSLMGQAHAAMALARPASAASGPTTSADRPNIVLILTDDQDAPSVEHMPRLQAHLVNQGTTFTNAFVTFSLCCPSRASILRGQYARNHRVLGNNPRLGGFETFYALGHEQSTVATWLQATGYRTALIGKYLNGYGKRAEPIVDRTYVPPGWDEWFSERNENGQLVPSGDRDEDYLTDVFGRKATDFIRRTADAGSPFFLYVATHAPHNPARPAPRHVGEFAGVTAPRPPSFNEADVGDKPESVRRARELAPADVAKLDELYRRRLQSLLAVDEMIESIVEALRGAGQLENTYIMFTSDNGFHLGEHRLNALKTTPYEEAIRVPLVVRGPGVAAGRALDSLVLNSDLAPTFAELADARIPDFVDGRSLRPFLRGEPTPAEWRRAFLVEDWDGTKEEPRLAYLAVRTREHVYVERGSGERELYDLRADPHQLESLHATADGALIDRLARWLNALRQCAGASCRAAERAAP